MTERDELAAWAATVTRPSEVSVERVRARIQGSLARDETAKVSLRDVPEPKIEALGRLRGRLLGFRAGNRRDGAVWPFRLGVMSAGAATAVVAFVILRGSGTGPDEAPRWAEQSPIPVEAGAPEKVAISETYLAPGAAAGRSAELSGRAPPAPIERAASGSSPKPHPPAGRRNETVLESLRAFGQVDVDSARTLLTQVAPAMIACRQRTGTEGAIEISVAVSADGEAGGLRLSDGSPDLATCLEGVILALRFRVQDGVRAGIEDEITGGVVRFRLKETEP